MLVAGGVHVARFAEQVTCLRSVHASVRPGSQWAAGALREPGTTPRGCANPSSPVEKQEPSSLVVLLGRLPAARRWVCLRTPVAPSPTGHAAPGPGRSADTPRVWRRAPGAIPAPCSP